MVIRSAGIFAVLVLVANAQGDDCHHWPKTCPGTLPPYKQTWMMNSRSVRLPSVVCFI